ncbi:MAG: hypothetical protein HEP71_03330 [Roseivirga sp.]|nr:hypothetical protein [Roseivirga sp.]
MKKLALSIALCLITFCLTAQNGTKAEGPGPIKAKEIIDYLETQFPGFKENVKRNNGLFIDGNIISIIMNHNGFRITGLKWPKSLKQSKKYTYRVLVVTPKDDSSIFAYKIQGPAYNPDDGFNILNTGQELSIVAASVEESGQFSLQQSPVSPPFSDQVKIQVMKDGTEIFKRVIVLEKKRYQVAIMGGYFYSTLNNPTGLTRHVMQPARPVPSVTPDTTLIGDFTKDQRKLTVMAVFHPIKRQSGFAHKKGHLSLGFGIGLDEDLFQDLFLGVNFEFAQGAHLAAGAHYGKHNVLANRPGFKYGKDPWNQPFDNALINQQWDLGFYAGVVIDLRVVSSMIGIRNKFSNSEDNDQ